MNNKELIKKLNQLKSVELDQSWKENNRAVLFNQISSSDIPEEAYLKERIAKNFIHSFRFFKEHILTPAWAGAIVLVFLVSSGVVVQASGDARPGSLLYYARLIKERTQLVATLDKKEKNKLNLKFASEHAKDITDVLKDPNFNKEEDGQKLAKNFEDSLESVKNSLKEIKAEEYKKDKIEDDQGLEEEHSLNEKNAAENNVTLDNKKEESENTEDKNDNQAQDNQSKNEEQVKDEDTSSEETFFVVDSGRGDDGLSVFDPSKEEGANNIGEVDVESNTEEASSPSTSNDISSEIESAEDISQNKDNKNLDNLISEAELLFDQEKYDEAREKIEEFMSIIEGANTEGEVKGAATTAPENISETENSENGTSSQE